MMFTIRNSFFRIKSFGIIFCKIYSIKNLPIFWTHFAINKLNLLHNHLWYSESRSGILNSKCSVPDSHERISHLENLHYVTFEDLVEPDLELLYERFKLKGLSILSALKYNLRVSPDCTRLLFPFYSLNKELSAIQTSVYNEDSENKVSIHFFSESEETALFGWSEVKPNEKMLVVTSDPLDAIAVNQMTGVTSIALPYKFSTFSAELLTALKEFNKVVFWMEPYLHDWEHHRVLSNALKENGYFIWFKEFNNPMFCFQNGINVTQILSRAYHLYEHSLETFDAYKDILYEESKNPEKISGVKWKRFAPLNEVLKGHRRGEVTVFSGHTGIGKTTFVSEYSLDLCIQGLPTLWANFEIPYEKLWKTMMCQYSMLPWDEILEKYDEWSNKFQKIHMLVLNFRQCHSLEGILSKMSSAVRLYNIQHIIVDNLQFMMNMDGYNSNIDQLRRQDQFFSAFREFATRWKCHITLVIHPRKEPQASELTITSISGTAKAIQEADNIIILQTTKSRQYLEVAKHRFDGDKGCILLEFDKKAFTYTMKKIIPKTKISDEKSSVL